MSPQCLSPEGPHHWRSGWFLPQQLRGACFSADTQECFWRGLLTGVMRRKSVFSVDTFLCRHLPGGQRADVLRQRCLRKYLSCRPRGAHRGIQPPSALVSPSVNNGSYTKQSVSLAAGLNEIACGGSLVHSGVEPLFCRVPRTPLDALELRDNVLEHLHEESSSPTTFQKR